MVDSAKIKKTVTVFIFTGLFSLFILSCKGADSDPLHSLEGSWKLIESDNSSASTREFNDSAFRNITIPGDWNRLLKKNDNYSSTVWLRKNFTLDDSFCNKPLYLSLGTIGVSDEVYINGIRIGSTGSIPHDPSDLNYNFAWQMPRVYFIPDNLIEKCKTNTLAVRVFSHVVSGIHGKIYIGEYKGSYASGVIQSYLPIISNISSVVLNIMLLFIILAIFISRPKQKEYIYFAAILLITIIEALLILDYGVITSGMVRYKVFLVLYSFANCSALLAIERFFMIDRPVIRHSAAALLIPITFITIFSDTTSSLIIYGGTATIAYITMCILLSALLIFLAVKKDPRRYWYFLVLAVLIPVSVIRNSYYLVTSQYHEFPLIVFFHVPVVFAVIILFQIYDLQKQKNEKETLYTALSKKTRKYEKLIESIQKTDAKPEPRDIIHDVIEHLKSNYSEKYNRHELARRFNLNEDYMGQIFKKTTGMNISTYVNKIRIDAALGLLTETEAKIIDIAYHIGFDNLTHFHRIFKNQTGMTPNEYRQRHSE